MSLLQKIAAQTEVCLLPGSKRKHMIFSGNISEGAPRVWDAAADGWAHVRAIIMQHYGIAKVRAHTMPSCGHAACISPTCLREGQTMAMDQIPRRIQSSDIFSLAQSGAFFDVADNLDSLSVTRAAWRMTPTGERPRFVGQRAESTKELFE